MVLQGDVLFVKSSIFIESERYRVKLNYYVGTYNIIVGILVVGRLTFSVDCLVGILAVGRLFCRSNGCRSIDLEPSARVIHEIHWASDELDSNKSIVENRPLAGLSLV